MYNLNLYEALVTVGTSKAELAFRREAQLCIGCGMGRRLDGILLCAHCYEEKESELMRAQWKAWDISA